MQAFKLESGMRRGSLEQGFAVEVLYPGLALNAGDSGVGSIGRIDRAQVCRDTSSRCIRIGTTRSLPISGPVPCFTETASATKKRSPRLA